jgi:transcriptional regulator with XRE-family HTH domain
MVDLQRYRRYKKLHQSDISEITGIEQPIISKYENKKYVSEFITEILLDKIPELKDYIIDDGIVKEDNPEYGRLDDHKLNLIITIKNLSESNKILAESISQAIELQKTLITKLKLIQ